MNTKILWPVGCAGALVIGWFIGFVMGGTPEVGNHSSSQPPMQTSAPSASKITRAAQLEPMATNDTDARAQMQTILGALHDTNYPRRTRDTCHVLHVNLDFRTALPDAGTQGLHRFWIGDRKDSPAIELLVSAEAIFTRSGKQNERLAGLKPNQWHNLQLTLYLESRTFSGRVGQPESTIVFSNQPFASGWSGVIDYVALDSRARAGLGLPVIQLEPVAVTRWSGTAGET